MKKCLIITLLSVSAITCARAQEYKVNKNSGKLILNLSSVTVEGYSGDQIVFSSLRSEAEMDPRAKGLRAINGSGFVDNTGLGVSVVEKGADVEVTQVAASNLEIKILVPKNVIVSFACHRVNSGTVVFKNMANEIESSTDYNKVELESVTGPVSVRALYGSVDARFKEPIKGPVSITSVYSTVDVAIPPATKANIKLNSSHGEILASADLKIEIEKTRDDGMISYSNNVNGKLNGGGKSVKLETSAGNITIKPSSSEIASR